MKWINIIIDKLFEAPIWLIIIGWVLSFIWFCLVIIDALKT